MSQELEKIIEKLRLENEEYKRAFNDANRKCTEALASREEMIGRAQKHMLRADKTVEELNVAFIKTRERVNKRLYDMGKLTEQEINSVVYEFPATLDDSRSKIS